MSAMRPRIDAALVALSPRVGNCSRWIHALRSIERRSINGRIPDVIWVFSSAQKLGRHSSTRSQYASTHSRGSAKIEQQHALLVVDPDHHVHRVVAAIRRHRIVGSAIDREKLGRVIDGRVIDVGFQPLVLEERPHLLRRLLLVKRGKVLGVRLRLMRSSAAASNFSGHNARRAFKDGREVALASN